MFKCVSQNTGCHLFSVQVDTFEFSDAQSNYRPVKSIQISTAQKKPFIPKPTHPGMDLPLPAIVAQSPAMNPSVKTGTTIGGAKNPSGMAIAQASDTRPVNIPRL
jgi:hypothetical protein